MPVHALPYILSSGSSISLVHPRIALSVFAIFIFLLVRRWSAGKDLIARLHIREQEEQRERRREREKRREKGLHVSGDDDDFERVGKSPERDLHGMTFLVVCNVASASSLLILSSLSSRGAQLILLLPSSSFTDDNLSSTLQYTQLLRDGTNNENIFAEECDLLDLKSIDGFCKKWNEQEGGQENKTSGAAAAAAATTSEGSRTKQPRRVDGLVFLPYQLRELQARSSSLDAELLGRFHLINSLLSTLLLLPPERDIRILNWISPWYAAGVQDFLEEQRAIVDAHKDTKKQQKKKSTKSADTSSTNSATSRPLTTASLGQTTLKYLLLTFELQRRLVLLAEADPRPRNPLPGILDTNHKAAQKVSSVDSLLPPQSSNRNYPNINVVNICPGFERDGEVSQWLWPVSNGPTANVFYKVISMLKTIVLAIFVYPLLFTVSKSPKAASEHFIWGIVAPLNVKSGTESLLAEVDGFDRMQEGDEKQPVDVAAAQQSLSWLTEPQEDQAGWKGIQPGRLYREGTVVRLPLGPDWSRKETLAELWADWERKVENVTGGLRRAGGKRS